MNNLFVDVYTLPFLLIVFFLLKKIGVIKKEWSKALNFAGFSVGLSSLIFLAFFQASITPSTLLNPFIGFLFAFSLFGIGLGLVKFLNVPQNYRPLFIASLVTLEGGAIGYPFFIAIFGVKNLPQIALLDLGMVFFAFTILTFYFCKTTNQTTKKLGEQVADLLKQPIFAAMVIGLASNLLGLKTAINGNTFAEFILRLIERLSALAIPLILLSIASKLEFNFEILKKTISFSFGSIIITFILAIVWSFAWKIIPLSPIAKGALFVMSLLPPSVYPAMLAEKINLSENNKEYIAQLFSITVFVSIIILLIVSPLIPKLITLW